MESHLGSRLQLLFLLPLLLLLLLLLMSGLFVDGAPSVLASNTVGRLPFVVLHGIGDQCSNAGMTRFVEYLSRQSGESGTCIEIGNGGPDSWTMHLNKQVDEVCRQVKAMAELQGGFNLVGLSQGNVIGRGYIEFCDGGPPVHNFVSLGGPHAGTASVPECMLRPICRVIDIILELGIYSPYVQDHIAPAGYVKIPTDLEAYRKGCTFLPRLNNELPLQRNVTYSNRLSALNHLALIMFEEDTVLLPAETAWFGYFADNTFDRILHPNETELYKEDWVGLRALDESGRVSYIAVPGNHLAITLKVVEDYIIPYISSAGHPLKRDMRARGMRKSYRSKTRSRGSLLVNVL